MFLPGSPGLQPPCPVRDAQRDVGARFLHRCVLVREHVGVSLVRFLLPCATWIGYVCESKGSGEKYGDHGN